MNYSSSDPLFLLSIFPSSLALSILIFGHFVGYFSGAASEQIHFCHWRDRSPAQNCHLGFGRHGGHQKPPDYPGGKIEKKKKTFKKVLQ
jgi:hypothetical protein